jgi:hypothetical protein
MVFNATFNNISVIMASNFIDGGNWSTCEFESHSDKVYSIQHYMKNFVSDLRVIATI